MAGNSCSWGLTSTQPGRQPGFGIEEDCAADFVCDPEGTALNYEAISDAVSSVRCAQPIRASWKERIVADHKKRGR